MKKPILENKINALETHNFAEYFKYYISLVEEDDLQKALKLSFKKIKHLVKNLTEEQGNFAYAKKKWTIKELLVHVMDTERIFSYRALCIARGDSTPLPGFDENQYALHSYATARNMNDIAREFSVLRASTIELIKSLNENVWSNTGTANSHIVSIPALFYAILGHEIHHMQVINERYLPQ